MLIFSFLIFFFNFDFVEVKKTNSLLVADCRGLVHLFCYRCLQMWSADCRHFTSEKTNSTSLFSPRMKYLQWLRRKSMQKSVSQSL
ncbi:putative transcription factor interactor and regulator CCHC(Zn) family [Helianthus anomalus]